MKKKVLAALMCAAMTVGMLAGCGGNSTAETPAPMRGKQHPVLRAQTAAQKKRDGCRR